MVEGSTVELEIRPSAAAQARAAVVILAAAGITVTFIYLLTGGGTQFSSPHTTLTTFVPDAAGLVRGSEVRLSGIPIGNVEKVDISGFMDPQRVVRVDMKVDARFLQNIPSDSKTTISADTLIGNQFVSIDEGTSPTPISQNAMLPAETSTDTIDQADLILALQDELRQADAIITQMSSPDTQLGAFVLGSKEYDELLKQVTSFERAMHTFVGPDSRLGPALFSDALYTDIRKDVAKVDDTLSAIQRGEGMAGRLFASDDQYNDLLRRLRDLRQSLAHARKGLNDDASYRRIDELLARADATIAAFNAGEGPAGRLMRDRRLYESLTGSLREIRKMLGDVRAHPEVYQRYKL
jgi:phospholipid/cholesterol/gamma-HCH transport system substrate-binding protein